MKPTKITTIFQNKMPSSILYGWVDGECEGVAHDIVEKWIQLHNTVLLPDEKMGIGTMSLETELAKNEFFSGKYELYQITPFYGREDLPMTRYEQLLYEDAINDWYQMYQNIVIAGTLLPALFCEDQQMSQLMDNLFHLADRMYRQIGGKDAFVQHLSTTHIKNTLICHPICAMQNLADEQDRWELFRYQMFNDN